MGPYLVRRKQSALLLAPRRFEPSHMTTIIGSMRHRRRSSLLHVIRIVIQRQRRGMRHGASCLLPQQRLARELWHPCAPAELAEVWAAPVDDAVVQNHLQGTRGTSEWRCTGMYGVQI